MEPRIEFLLELWASPTTRRAQKFVPFVREVTMAAQTGLRFARAGYELEQKLGGRTSVDLYSPSIRRYTQSALGSSRII